MSHSFQFTETKPLDHSTASLNNEQKPTTFSLTGSNNSKPSLSDTLSKTTMENEKGLTNEVKKGLSKEDDKFFKSYQAPSFNHLLENGNDFLDDDMIDVEFDSKTNLPIRKLKFDDSQKSLLNGQNHLNFAISDKTDSGVIFATTKPGHKSDGDGEAKLFSFDLIPKGDESNEYFKFLNNIYKEIEPLLKNQKYEHFADLEDEMEIGVVSAIKKSKDDRFLELRRIMAALLSNLELLINKKLQQDISFADPWIVNYENTISVLYLMNALYFGEDDETIVLFQQWVERVDIQPDARILQELLDDSEKLYLNPKFWSVYVKKLILRGSFSVLEEDFRTSQYEQLKDEDSGLFKIINDFYNLIISYDPIKFSKNTSDFLSWKKEAVALREAARDIDTSNLAILGEIVELLEIISGSVSSIEENSDKWYEYFMGRFLYQMPSKKLVGEYISQTLELDSFEVPLEGIESWDSICIDLFKGRLLTVISALESFDKTIGTYSAVLLEAAGLLRKYYDDSNVVDQIEKVETSNSIRNNINRMVEDLALSYLNNQDLFPIGVGILINSGNGKSREILAEVLPTYEIKDSDDFEWVLEICSQLKLKKTMVTIQEIQGEKLYEKQLIGNALVCFAQSQIIDKVVSIAWRIFEETLLNKGLDEKIAMQLSGNAEVHKNAILRQSLSPIYVLDEILKTKDGYDDVWFERLISLFTFRYLHGYYKPGLLMIVLETLNKSVYNFEKLLKLIEAINDYEDEFEKNEDTKEKSEQMYVLLTQNNPGNYPEDVRDLLIAVRRGIALDITFGFLE
ncbi:hypothetical protein CANINC_004288 [Pichia inconspicua]|uniref:Nuclear pore complex protein Nup85 n=1 Tax=Pichia inconspicua TaxID=52247 RepID=A0A4T0WWC1_9ASCO|nr:hypothetical protein CANINC_004288 [[Candida] inconspicua]